MKYLIFLLSLTWFNLSHAFQIEPMIHSLQTHGANAQAEYRVENTGTEPLAIESEVFARSIISNIDESLEPADRDFIVMPPQAVIPPGEFQLFRARYLGSQELDESTSYRIVFKQLPLQYDADGSGVDLLFNFATLVFVSPTHSSASIQTNVENDDIEVTNIGNGVANLNLSLLTLSSEMDNQTLSWNDFGEVSPASYLLPNQTVRIPRQPEWLEGQNITDASLSIEQ